MESLFGGTFWKLEDDSELEKSRVVKGNQVIWSGSLATGADLIGRVGERRRLRAATLSRAVMPRPSMVDLLEACDWLPKYSHGRSWHGRSSKGKNKVNILKIFKNNKKQHRCLKLYYNYK